MKNLPTLAYHQTNPDQVAQVEMTRYQAIIDDAEPFVSSLEPPLQAIARPLFDKLVPGEFSQVVSLLPFWLSDLAPVEVEIQHRLGLAHFFFWWFYYVQDEILDDDASPQTILVGHLALLKMVDLYRELGVTQSSYWPSYYELAQLSAQAHAIELQSRFTLLNQLTPQQLAPITLEFLANRFAPLFFNSTAQLHLAGIPGNNPLHNDLGTALRAFALARQLDDDASDWLTDLQAGQLNYVSAQLIQQLMTKEQMADGSHLDFDRLNGYQLLNEAFWLEIEQTSQDLNQQALSLITSYGPCRLHHLIQHQINQHTQMWAEAKDQRRKVRSVFGVEI